MNVARTGVFSQFRFPNWGLIKDIKLWFGQWDFHFYQWLEQVDYYGQEAWLTRVKFKREWCKTHISHDQANWKCGKNK